MLGTENNRSSFHPQRLINRWKGGRLIGRLIEISWLSEMRCGLMYGGYGSTGTAWWARHVSLLLPHSLVSPSRVTNQQTTPVANCSPIHPEPLNTSRTGSPRRSTPEKAKFGENFNLLELPFLFLFVKKLYRDDSTLKIYNNIGKLTN